MADRSLKRGNVYLSKMVLYEFFYKLVPKKIREMKNTIFCEIVHFLSDFAENL